MLLKKGSLVLSGVFLFVAWNALLLLFLWGWPPVGRPAERGGAEPGGGEEWGLGGRRGSGGLAVDFIRLAERVEAELETQKRLLQQIHSHWALRKRKKEDELKKTEQLSIPPQKDTAFADIDQNKGKSPHDLIVSHKRDNKVLFNENYSAGSAGASQVIIPILVIACDRVTVKRCLDKLIEYRPSAELYPIIVSQDCGHTETAHVIQSYGSLVTHLSQPDLSDILVRREHKKFKGYYKISRHYRWALNQVFNSFLHSSVVVVEDDLEVAPDFFEYFRALHPILRSDPTLWCVSAWNDNGRDGLVDMRKAELLYRTDFFPGLGWMLLKELWAELEPKWPAAFWDDWMRQPDQRRDRSCIRPEISRTITFGRRGVSLGQFFDQYLRYIKLSTEFVIFTKLDLSYLVNERYNEMFEREVYFAPLVKVEELQAGGKLKGEGPFRVQYSSRDGFKVMARSLGVMEDLKSGVPRAGYRGVVSFLARGRRIYLAPPPGWSHYDTSWS